MDYKIEVTLDKNDLAYLHDAYVNAIYDLTEEDVEVSDDELLSLWNRLDENIRLDALKWELCDTEVRENVYEFVQNEYKQIHGEED